MGGDFTLKKLNNYICFGLFLNAISVLLRRIDLGPNFYGIDFMEGACLALGLVLIVKGICIENNSMAKIRNYKKNLFNRVLRK